MKSKIFGNQLRPATSGSGTITAGNSGNEYEHPTSSSDCHPHSAVGRDSTPGTGKTQRWVEPPL